MQPGGNQSGQQAPGLNPRIMAAISGAQQGAAQAPMQGPPTMSQPGGFQPPTDVFKPYFDKLCAGIKALANMLRRPGVGDTQTANFLDRMAVQLEQRQMRRADQFKKIAEAHSQLNGQTD